MKLYNTMTMKKEEFTPLEPGKVKMYACGPTVYNYIHVGNARPIIIFDALRRFFEYLGYDVAFVQNFTDVDDKIINRTGEENLSCDEIAGKYIGEYLIDARGLGVREATVHPKATENIDGIISMASELVGKGCAYQVGNDVYYRTSSFPEYGKLSHQQIGELVAGARVDVADGKENPMDFALWKGMKPGEPHWDSPWGKGRPGWHIECSAMAKAYLGDTIDIHCGGQDLIFPHHENEIAQSEGCHGKPFARYWLHNGFISIDSKKMSKSLGNFFTVREAAEAYGYENIRMFMLMSHYRSPLNYSGEILVQSKSALERLKTARGTLEFIAKNGSDAATDDNEEQYLNSLPLYRERFIEALSDDFNTADAISVMFEMARESNSIAAAPAPTKAFAAAALEVFDELAAVLGLFYADVDAGGAEGGSGGGGGGGELAADVERMIAERQTAREEKDWEKADSIRTKLGEMGIVLEDTPQGVKWKKL